jgi:hypothetical protein
VIAIVVEPNIVRLNKKGKGFVDKTFPFRWPEEANALARRPDKFINKQRGNKT